MMNYFKNMWLWVYTTLVGLKITFCHIFAKKVTVQYPHERYPIPDIARNRLYLKIIDCIGCNQCAVACPVNCITLETVKCLPTDDLGMTSKGTKKRLWVTKFDIDFAKCAFCGLCTLACPTECLCTTTYFEYSEYKRGNLKYSFANMTSKEIQQKKDAYATYEKEQAAQKVAANNNETKTS